MANDYQTRLVNEINNMGSRVVAARSFYNKYPSYLERYRGGIHSGFLAAIAQWESGGKMDATGDVSLGEYGFFQVASDTPGKYGLAQSIRNTPEGNIFIGSLEYNMNAARLHHEHHDLIANGSIDHWLLSRLTFAIGYGGSMKLLEKSNPSYGHAFSSIVDHVNKGGAISLGSQSADLIWYRVNAIKLQYAIGTAVNPSSWSRMAGRIPAPQGIRYTVPKDYELADYTLSGIITAWGAAALLAYWTF